MVQLDGMKMWVQIYDISRGFISEKILRSIGSSMGQVIKLDPTTFDGAWKQYVRIRILINISKPLKRRLKLKREGDSRSCINFKYECLGTFCFVCGILGHSEGDCSVVYNNPDKVIEKTYGSWLRAPSKSAARTF